MSTFHRSDPTEVNLRKRTKLKFKIGRLQVTHTKIEVSCWLSTVAKSTRTCVVWPGGDRSELRCDRGGSGGDGALDKGQ